MFLASFDIDSCFFWKSSKKQKNEGLADIWRQFSRNLEQNFDFRDFRGSRVTSCRKWRHNDVMMTLTQIFLCHSSWLELVYNTAKAFRLRPSRSAISSGGVIFTPPPCRIGGKKSPCRIGLMIFGVLERTCALESYNLSQFIDEVVNFISYFSIHRFTLTHSSWSSFLTLH